MTNMEWYYIVLIIIAAIVVWIMLSALFYKQFFKRFYDIVLSLLALIVLSPVLLILTILGAVKMKGNPFFTQLRPGKNEKIFKLIKFRTMTSEKDKDGNLLPDEKRLTKYGKILRSTSLDELPELLNILKGDMSIVGPRPQLVRDMVFMTSEQRKRHNVRPGLTGYAQVNGRNNITWEQKFEYDLQYVNCGISFINDTQIVFHTFYKVLKRNDIVRCGTESDMDFGDWLLMKGKINQDAYDEKHAEAKDMIKKRS